MALVYESRNELPAALLFINKAISMNPRKGGAYYNRAIIYDRLENREAAIADLTKALDFDPILELKVLSNRAVLLLETENYLRAISDLSRLIDIDARNYMYYYNRAYAKLQSGDRAGAINDYREVVKLNPGDQETINLIRTLIAETGRK
jgi:tetratricopeptide (TPR) repeat protein